MSETTHSEFARSEAKIISLAQAGNADAFGELYQLHLDAISRYIQRRVNEIDEVENLTQTVFVKAWQAIARYQPTKAPFRAWLYRIAGNTVIDYYRTRKETVDLETQWALPDGKRSPEEVFVAAERDESVRTAVDELRPTYRQVLSLRFLDECDYPETAQVLDRKVHAVRMLQHRALGAMRKALSEEQVYWLVATVAALSLALGGGVATAAEGALPGDLLYPVKRAAEISRLSIADDTREVELRLEFAGRRVDELSQLWDAGQTDELASSAALYVDQIADIFIAVSKLAEVDSDQSRQMTDQLSTSLFKQADALTSLVSDGAAVLSVAASAADEAGTALDDLRIVPSHYSPPDEPSDESADRGSVQPLDEIDAIPMFVDASAQRPDGVGLAVPEPINRTSDTRLEPETADADLDNDPLVESAAMTVPDLSNRRLAPQSAAQHQDSDGAELTGDQTGNARVSPPRSGSQRSAASAPPNVAPPKELYESGQPGEPRYDFETDAVDRAGVDHSVAIPLLPNSSAPEIKPPEVVRVDDMRRQDGDQRKAVVGADADAASESLPSGDERTEHSAPAAQSELEPPLRGSGDGGRQGPDVSPAQIVDSNAGEQAAAAKDRSRENGSVQSESQATNDDRPPEPSATSSSATQDSDRPSQPAPDADLVGDERRPDQESTDRDAEPERKEESVSGSDRPEQRSDEPEKREDRRRG